MSIRTDIVEVAGNTIEVVRKDIKNMHLGVYPPEGKVRLSAPFRTEMDVVRMFAISKLGWIKKQKKLFRSQARETERTYVSRESHYYRGNRYLLDIVYTTGRQHVELIGSKTLRMHVRIGSNKEQRAKLMKEWYRTMLKKEIPTLLEKWQPVVGVEVEDWGIKQMRTKWGTCNTQDKRIWLNLELAKKPIICLEYILVHELVHLHERHHNDRFIALLDRVMPKWRQYREELNSLPIVHNDWGY